MEKTVSKETKDQVENSKEHPLVAAHETLKKQLEDLKKENETLKGNTEKKENKYAILMETNGEEFESWYYFIKYNGNEENLNHLQKQLESVEWYLSDEDDEVNDLSTFDLELDFLVSEQTAKEMTKVDLNSCYPHRKFDGTLQKIDLGFKKRHSDEKKMIKAFDILGYGQIEDFIDQEDCDEEDSDSSEESEESDSSEESEESEEEEDEKKPKKKVKGIPPALLNSNLPRMAKAKRKKHKKKN